MRLTLREREDLAKHFAHSEAFAPQGFLRAGNGEAGYMPAFTDLPEGLAELQFRARYEDLNSATYALIDTEIENRISGVAIHRSSTDGP